MPSRTPQAAAPDRGAAARGEANGTPKTVEFRALTITLPAELPGALVFDLAELELGEKSLSPITGILKSMLGDEQYAQLQQTIRDERISLNDTIDELGNLIDAILSAHGLAPGESEASPDS